MCRVLGVSPSGYYAWRKRGLSRRRREDAALLERVRRIWEGSGRTYGAPRVWAELRACGVRCSRKRLSAADAGGGAGGGLPPEATEEDHGAGPTGSRSSGPGGTAVPGGRPQPAVGSGSGAGPHGRGLAVPRGHPGRVASGGSGLGHAPGCSGGVGGGRFGDGAMETATCPGFSAPLRPRGPVHEPTVRGPAGAGWDAAFHGQQGRCLRQRPVRGVLRHAPPGGGWRPRLWCKFGSLPPGS
jgi:hypothetical protein